MRHEMDIEVDRPPSRIFCFIDYPCNNDCIHCLVGDKKSRPALDLKELKEMLDEGLAHCPFVEIGGGEPTLSKKLFPILEYLSKKGATIRLFTNARRLKDKNFCAKIKVDRFAVTLHSHRKEIHEAITQRRGSFEEMVQGIQNIKALGKTLEFLLLIHKWNYRELIPLVRFAESFRPSILTFESLHYAGHAVHGPLGIRLSKLAPQIEKALEYLEDRIPVALASYPLCLFHPRYWKYFINMRHRAALHNLTYHKKWTTVLSSQELGQKCQGCRLNVSCPGVLNTYLAQYGENELKPFKKQKAFNL